MVTKKAVKKSAKKSAHTPKADAAEKKAAKIVKVKKELAKEVVMEKRTVKQKVDDAVEPVKDFVSPPEPVTGAPVEPINSFDELVAAAWDEVRGADPPIESVAPDFVNTLRYRAKSALKGNAQEGESQLALFEQAIQRLRPHYRGE